MKHTLIHTLAYREYKDGHIKFHWYGCFLTEIHKSRKKIHKFVFPLYSLDILRWTKQTTTNLKLNQIQRSGCLTVTGAMWSTPMLAMKVILNLLPFEIYLKVALTTMMSLKDACIKLFVEWNEAVSEIQLLQIRAGCIPT